MSIIIKGGSSGNLADVDTDKNLAVKTTLDEPKAGFAGMSSEVDSGKATGTRLCRSPEVNDDYAHRVATDYLMFEEKFVGAALNRGLWYTDRATMTVAVNVSFVTLNNNGSLASGARAQIRSYPLTPTLGTNSTYIQFRVKTENGYVANKCFEIGLGFAAGTSDPTDGVFFRWTKAGELFVVCNNNGSEESHQITSLADNETNYFCIVLSQENVEYWINNVLQWSLETPYGANRPVRSASLPIYARAYNSGNPPLAPKLMVSDIQVFQGGSDMDAPIAHQMARCGGQANQGQTGFTVLGTQSNVTNSMTVASATLSNNALPAGGYDGSKLGGYYQFAAVAGSDTDLIMFAYQVPPGSAAGQAKALYVTDISISAMNLGANVAVTPTILEWTLGFGSSSVDLATVDGDTTKAPRLLPLDSQTFIVGAAQGTRAPTILRNMDSPVVVFPGQYLHVILKIPVSTATVNQVIRGQVSINGYWW